MKVPPVRPLPSVNAAALAVAAAVAPVGDMATDTVAAPPELAREPDPRPAVAAAASTGVPPVTPVAPAARAMSAALILLNRTYSAPSVMRCTAW